MRIFDKHGRQINTGDIVWGKKPYIFLRCDGTRIEIKSMDGRGLFSWVHPSILNLTLEA